MPQSLASLSLCLENALGSALVQTFTRLDELTIVVSAQDLAQTMRRLRDHDDCRFEQLIDLCGLDYSEYGDGVRVLDVDPGRATNRTVITFVGAPGPVCEAAFRLVKQAQEVAPISDTRILTKKGA